MNYSYNESKKFLLLYYVLLLNQLNKDLSKDWLSRTRIRTRINIPGKYDPKAVDT